MLGCLVSPAVLNGSAMESKLPPINAAIFKPIATRFFKSQVPEGVELGHSFEFEQ